MKLAAFVVTSVVLAITPGPGVLFIVARTLADGRRAGLAAVAGIAAGNGVNAVAAALGLAALLALWPPGITLMRIAGGTYLIALGLLALRAPAAAPPAAAAARAAGRQAIWVALLNPKTTIFFAALLPSFVDPAGPAVTQSLILGAVFVAIAALTDGLYVLAAGALSPRLAGGQRWGRRVAAAVYIGLGLYAIRG